MGQRWQLHGSTRGSASGWLKNLKQKSKKMCRSCLKVTSYLWHNFLVAVGGAEFHLWPTKNRKLYLYVCRLAIPYLVSTFSSLRCVLPLTPDWESRGGPKQWCHCSYFQGWAHWLQPRRSSKPRLKEQVAAVPTGLAAALICICGTDLRQIVVPLGISNLLLNGGFRQ